MLPALGRSTDHANPPPGLSFKHFVVGGVICTLLLVATLIAVVTLVLTFVAAK